MVTKEEAEGRVFPVSDKAQSVLDVLVNYMKGRRARSNQRTCCRFYG